MNSCANIFPSIIESIPGGQHLFPFEMCGHSDLGIFADAATEEASWVDNGSWDPDCTIMEFHAAPLHKGEAAPLSEAWENIALIGSALVPPKIILSLSSWSTCACGRGYCFSHWCPFLAEATVLQALSPSLLN